ncbi:hypothetical protein [Dyella sp.]|uniref:hypothetical protein n=1 Tax=Dyella sp. TaxID=1869338 RepID=UPI002ED4F0A8
MNVICRPLIVVLVAAALAAGCSQQDDEQAAAKQQAAADAAQQKADQARKLDNYRQLAKQGNDEMTVLQGEDIVQRYPGTDAAKEVQQSLPAVEQRLKDTKEKARLQALWYYQVAPMQGGTQSTATIYSTLPAGNDRVRLVLRRHTEWGQNAFLYGNGHGFVCKGNCTINAKVDGKPVGIKGFAPTTGEPAIMIRDDKAFIALVEKAKRITLDVTTKDDEKHETLVYEVGGFDPSKWQPLSKGKK